MEIERKLGFEPTDREPEKLGYDIESRVPGTGKLRFLEVKGHVSGADTVTVTKNEILYSLIKRDAIAALHDSGKSLRDGGTGANAYADAVGTYCGLAVSKAADYNSSLVIWSPGRDQAKSTEVLGTLPGSTDLLRAIIDFNLVGVQTERDADNLRRGLVQELGAIAQNEDTLEPGGKSTRVKSFPIGIDVSDFQEVAVRSRSNRIVSQTIAGLGSRKLIIGVDRLDYSKGIPQRMEAYERFLVNNTGQRGHVTYLQIAPTSRSEVPEYEMVSRAVNETLGRINGSVGEPGWVPIQYVTSTYPRAVLAALYRLAQVALVTPMRDGMNLVAKEYVAAQDPLDPGVSF
jgi:hypothetical protein